MTRVLGELKLSLSGVTEQEDALSAGKLAKADLLVLGSVEKLGKSYHVNVRLVSSETGEVLAAAYESLPVSDFEEEAREYVALVPKAQTIGIYFLAGYRVMDAPQSTLYTYSPNPFISYITTTPEDKAVLFPGFGIRYCPAEHLLVDLSYMNPGASQKTGKLESDGWMPESYNSRFSLFRAVAGPKGKVFDSVSYSIGAGVTLVSISGHGYASYTTPTILAGLEFRPQQRIGVSFSVGYDMKTKTATGNMWAPGNFKITRLPHFYIEPSLALYF